jgi:hypothetical protein
MYVRVWGSLAALAILGLGCDAPRGPKLALSTNRSAQAEAEPGSAPEHRKPMTAFPSTMRYQGRTIDQWAQALNDEDASVVRRACHSLRVMGATGRPYLVEALENSHPETRRLCLEALTVSDLKAYGEQVRQLLLKLAGDSADLRIRQRAAIYVTQWRDAVPAPP